MRSYDDYGHSVTIDPAGGSNYAVPGMVKPNGSGTLATSASYAESLALTSIAGPNNDATRTTYDSYGRVATRTSPHGAVTTYGYDYDARRITATTPTAAGDRVVESTLDGFGRTVRVDSKSGSTVVSRVDTEYGACACSPLGKVQRVSQPYVPGATVWWTSYEYDRLGRTTQATAPDGSITTYAYAGNTVTVTDPAGKWKKFTRDAFGQLTQVTEPDPGGGADVETLYTYDVVGHLTKVQMTRTVGGAAVTQTRTWIYDANQRLASRTQPESGTVVYTYNGDGSLASRTDANNQRVSYSYADEYGQADPLGRLRKIERYPAAGGAADPCQEVTFSYDQLELEGGERQTAVVRRTRLRWANDMRTCSADWCCRSGWR